MILGRVLLPTPHHISSSPHQHSFLKILSVIKQVSEKNIPELFIVNDRMQEEFCQGAGSNCLLGSG